jgi:putative addiction module component (TIGR02574 family)
VNSIFEELKATAVQLSSQERAALASYLLSTLEEEDDPAEVSETWEREIVQRLADLEAGRATCYSLDEAFAIINARRS